MNYILQRNVEFFSNYDCLAEVANKNTISSINQKLEIIIQLKENIKYNANAQLLVDKLIMELVGGVK
jgi:hypothetical protein